MVGAIDSNEFACEVWGFGKGIMNSLCLSIEIKIDGAGDDARMSGRLFVQTEEVFAINCQDGAAFGDSVGEDLFVGP